MTFVPVKFTATTGFRASDYDIPEPWLTTETFRWLLEYDSPDAGEIIVPAGFPFDGASIPPIPVLRLIFPRVHPAYMQSAALHDWCLQHERHRFSRYEIDLIFREALQAQRNPKWRVNGMFRGVSLWGRALERKNYWRQPSFSES